MPCGISVAEVFDRMCCVERARDIRIAALPENATPRPAHPDVAARVAQQFKDLPYKAKKTEWEALLRMLETRVGQMPYCLCERG